MIKKIQMVFVVLFFVILFIPVVTVNVGTNQISEMDNRELNEFPSLERMMHILSDEAVHWEFEDAMSDRIGYRSEMIQAYTVANDKLFHEMVHPTYTYGKDGYVFFKMPTEILDESYMDTYADFVEKIQKDCEEQDKSFLYWLNPGKMVVYSEKLPYGVNLYHKDVEHLEKRLQEKDVSYIYTKDALLDAKKSIQVFDVKYDAGHWNDDGAFIGVNAMLQYLIDQGQNVQLLSKDDFEIHEEKRLTLPVSYFEIDDQDNVYTLKEEKAVRTDVYDGIIEMNEQYSDFDHYVNPDNPDAPKVLFFRGSYMAGRTRFLMNQFSELTCVSSYYNIQNYQQFIDLLDPDIVILECADYVLNQEYYPLENMQSVLE